MNLKEAMEYLHVSKPTMNRWDDTGVLVAIRTPGGHRRYYKSQLDEMIGKTEETESINRNEDIRAVVYARCSTTEQKTRGDIERQAQRNTEYAV